MNSNKTAFAHSEDKTVNTNPRLLNGKYVMGKVITESSKGYVRVARMIKGLSWKKCIIKQGKKNTSIDPGGRDIVERLRWQQTVYEEINREIQVPEVYEYFEVDGDGYLATAYIEGVSLYDQGLKTFRSSHWKMLSPDEQFQLLHYLKQVIKLIEKFHKKGFVHRDITATNFLIDSSSIIWPIDMELVYDSAKNLPNPAFASGTRGYVAPEQLEMLVPDEKADIYSLGALMIFVFTGMEPAYLVEGNRAHLESKLTFLISDASIASLILACIDENPKERPGTILLNDFIDRLKADVFKQKPPTSGNALYSADDTKEILQRGINALGWDYMLQDGLWASQVKGSGSNAVPRRQVCMGMHEGICGVVYLLSRAQKAGYNISETHKALDQAFTEITEKALPNMAGAPAGLSTGSAGFAVAVTAAIDCGLLPMRLNVPSALRDSLFRKVSELNVTSGMAGHGLATLQYEDYAGKDQAEQYLHAITEELLDLQQPDGSWITGRTASGLQEKDNSFGYGIAGILYYLLKYYDRHKSPAVLSAIDRGLTCLERISIKRDNQRFWKKSDLDRQEYFSWFMGAAGNALPFISAYQILGDQRHRAIAEDALRSIPEQLVHTNLGLCYGVSGVGEIMLEATAAFQSEEWQERGNWIASYLSEMSVQPNVEMNYWRTDDGEHFTADLMVGSGGVLHFLLRYNDPSRFGLPLVG